MVVLYSLFWGQGESAADIVNTVKSEESRGRQRMKEEGRKISCILSFVSAP
jgi:hypothetical protein